MSKGYYMVRAMGQGEVELALFLDRSVVAVGWSKIDFTEYKDSDALAGVVYSEYYEGRDFAPQTVGRRLNEVRRFKNIDEGSRIVVPYWGSVCLAEATHEEKYNREDKPLDLCNQHGVKYLRAADRKAVRIPRTDLTEGLQRRLRVRGTCVADLDEFSEEIDDLFLLKVYDVTMSERLVNLEAEFKQSLLSNIRNGRTGLQAGGYGLEKLVKELLEIDGYSGVKIMSKSRFEGFADADLEARKADAVCPTSLLVQVKCQHRFNISRFLRRNISHFWKKIMFPAGVPTRVSCDFSSGMTLLSAQ